MSNTADKTLRFLGSKTDAFIRAITAAYLIISPCSFLVAGVVWVTLYDVHARSIVVGGALCLLAFGGAVFLIRGRIWPVAILAGVLSLLYVVAAVTTTAGAGGGLGRSISLLHIQVLIPVVAWAFLRRTRCYWDYAWLQIAVFLLIFSASVLAVAENVQESARFAAKGWDTNMQDVVGTDVGELRFETPTGEPVSVGRSGEIGVLYFWSTRCRPCVESLPEIVQAQSWVRGVRGARLLLVLPPPESAGAAVRGPIARMLKDGEYVHDTKECGRRLGVDTYPTIVFLEGGKVTGIVVGEHEKTRDLIVRGVEEIRSSPDYS